MPSTLDDEITLDLIPVVLMLTRLLDNCEWLTRDERERQLNRYIDVLVDERRETSRSKTEEVQ